MTNQEIKNITSESLRDWFRKEKWVRISTSGNIAGPCGTSKNKKNPDRCLPKAKAQSLSKAERAATARKKKKAGKKGKTVVKNTKKATVKKENISERIRFLSPEKQKANDAKFEKRMAALKALEKGKELHKAGKISDEELHNLKLKAGTISADSKFKKEDIKNLVVGLLHETQGKEVLMEKDDRCTRLAKQKYDTWPSAYASGAVVRCRRGEIWKKK